MKRYWFIICLASIVSILACKTIKSRPTSPLIPTVRIFKSNVNVIGLTNGQVICGTNRFGKPFCYTNEPPVPINPLKSFGFTYSGITNNVVFNVFGSSNLSSWNYKGTVTNMWFTIDVSKGEAFYKVQASNTVTHFVSR